MSRLRRLAQGGSIALLILLALGLAAYGAFERAVERRVAGFAEPAVGTEVLGRHGRLLRAFAAPGGVWRLDAGPDDVDPRYLRMLLAWEDRRFEAHDGVDLLAFGRSMIEMAEHRRVVSGGSTLTMQVARMLERLPTGSFAAKLDQILGAVALERTRSKSDILRLYLRLAPYGGNVEGVRAASLTWLGKEPGRLTAAEAALLVAMPQSPERIRPDRYPERAKRARDRVLARMSELGVLDPAEATHAMAEPVPSARRELPILAAHAAARLHAERPDAWRIDLTLDETAQADLEAYARGAVSKLPKPVSLAILVSDASTGEIVASVGSPDLFDASRQGFVDLTRALRSPGSTLKPLIYGLAFELGVAHPESLVDDSPAAFAGYAPENFDRVFEGTITARRALQLSRNLPAVELLSAVGPSRLVYRMRRAGVEPELGDRSLPGLAIGLGGIGLRLTDLVAIYGGIANGGLAEPLRIEPVSGLSGPVPKRILSEQAAWYVSSILAGAPVTAKGSPGTIAWKTGTSYGYRDAWTVGYDGRHVVGVWLGRPDGAPVPGLVGQDSAAPMMRDVFARLGKPVALPGPPPGILADASAALPPPLKRVGRAATEARSGLAPEIVYPPDKAQVEVGFGDAAGGTLFLKVRNGRPPFTWYADGRPVARDVLGRSAQWSPDATGFVALSVVDSTGAAARTRVLVK
ncbi:penicillin-binding protein 1C [Antarcticirhabdus aurantiaca]|uniref:Penicillin-binding protein 1C n=1 Tax=Antarcticirhabdus aurantiaca TaxID=2606717 RepID=A0ACD4NKD5_9HYPH|nr:penicillin-binding protein 1C [Antarcticirhabdus aurantiaca]WAJ27106.1 penicillin-binding protein 1C [Jeongeuplla avenae]